MNTTEYELSSIESKCNQVYTYLSSINATQGTIGNHRFVLKQIIRYFHNQGQSDYDEKMVKKFIKKHNYNKLENDPGHLYFRTCMLLMDLSAGIKPSHKYNRITYGKTEIFHEIKSAYKEYLINNEQKKKTIVTKLGRLSSFFKYLNSHKLNINEVNTTIILDFLNEIKIKHKDVYRYNIINTLRDFLKFLYEMNYIDKEVSTLVLSTRSPNNKSIPSYYSKNEIQSILNSIDTTNLLGRRNYLIIYLIVVLGIRAIDVSLLKIRDIDFEKHEITFKQSKTNIFTTLPIPMTLISIIVEYLLMRKEHQSEYLIIRNFKAYQSDNLTSSAITAVVARSINNSGINILGRKHGAHSLRHSLATQLLYDDVSYPTISKILGHTSMESTKYYARINIKQLKKLVLEVPLYEM